MGFNVDGIPEVVIDNYNGVLINPYDINIYKERLNNLINNPKLMSKFSKNSRKIALKKWSQQIVSNQYLEIFKSI